MGLLLDLLTLPVLGGPRLAHWLANTIGQASLEELLDERPVRVAMMELYEQYDTGAMNGEEYDRQEQGLLERLNVIRHLKAQQ